MTQPHVLTIVCPTIVLAWITEQFARHDSSDTAEADLREFLASIQTAKPTFALDDIGDKFAHAADLDLAPVACRRTLKRMDEAAQAPLDQAWEGIFNDSLGRSIAGDVWLALVNFYRNLYCGYAHCLGQLPAPDALDAAERQDAVVLATRAMSALVSHKALMRIRYRDPHPDFWTDTYALIERARHYGIFNAAVKPYSAGVQQTTVEREYVTGLLLEVSPVGNLLPTQTYCLNLLLRRYSDERYADGRLTGDHGVSTTGA